MVYMTLYMQWSLSIVTTTGTTSLGPRPCPPHYCYYWLHNSSDMRMRRIESGFRTNWDHCLSFITFYLFIYLLLFIYFKRCPLLCERVLYSMIPLQCVPLYSMLFSVCLFNRPNGSLVQLLESTSLSDISTPPRSISVVQSKVST